MLFSSAVFQRKKSRYCHHSGVVVSSGVVVMKNLNLGSNFLSVEGNRMKLHMLVHHHKGYNMTKDLKFARLFDKTMPLNRYAKMDCVLITGVSIVCVDYRSISSLACVLIIGKSMAWNVY